MYLHPLSARCIKSCAFQKVFSLVTKCCIEVRYRAAERAGEMRVSNWTFICILICICICIVFILNSYCICIIFISLIVFWVSCPGPSLSGEMLKKDVSLFQRETEWESWSEVGSQIGSRNHFGQIYSRTPANLVKRICPFEKRKKTPPIKTRACLCLSNI